MRTTSQIWIVTTQAREELSTGQVIGFHVRTWGAYTDATRAQQIADKYLGTVTGPVTVDQEQGANLESWTFEE